MALDITVNLTTEQVSGTAGTGVPLLLAGNQTKSVPFTICSNLKDLEELGFTPEMKIYEAVKLLKSQNNPPKNFAIQTTKNSICDVYSEFKDEAWRQAIVVEFGDKDTVTGFSDWIEAREDKMFFVSISIDGASALSDSEFTTQWVAAISDLKDNNRTVIMYYDDTVDTPEAALVGATAAYNAGEFTYKNMILTGVPALKLSDARIAAISGSDETGHALTVVSKAGDIVTTDGKTASGEYIDVVDSRDWIMQNITYDLQSLLNTQPKVPYTDPGITQMENITLSVLKTAFNNGMIAPTEDNESVGNYSTTFASKAEIREQNKEDIKNRYYPGGRFTFELAGAIHQAEINGLITW